VSEDLVELARGVMALVGRGDLEELVETAHPEVEWHSFFAELGEGGVYRGHDGMRRYVEDLRDAWELVRADVDDALRVGSSVALTGRIHYKGKGSGLEAEEPVLWVLTFRDRKVILFKAFRDPERTLETLRRPA
jgi:ketosteroid isomerase-like protein